jgi:hypothetical protein
MKTIRFIGIYDKTDLMINVAKILTEMSKKVLVIDFTLNQKARYVVPAIEPTVSYITSFEDIDVAVGFENIEQIKKYLGTTEFPYDIALMDIDIAEKIQELPTENIYRNYFVTSFDVYSLKKGIEILSELKTPIPLTKILFSKEMLKEEDDYLNYLSLGYKIEWDETRIYFPIENGDLTAIYENQRVQKIKFRRLSAEYKDSLIFVVQQILNEKSDTNIRRTLKNIEKIL